MLVGYIRASFDDGRETTVLQRDALIAAGVDPKHVFEEPSSPPSDGRVALEKCLAILEPGDSLVVWRLDRLGRSMPDLLRTIEDLRRREVGFRSLVEKIDAGTTHGDALFDVVAALSRCERTISRERILTAVAAIGRKDRRGGRPTAIDPRTMEAVLDALDKGVGKTEVCRSFGIARSTLYETLGRIGWAGSRERRGRSIENSGGSS